MNFKDLLKKAGLSDDQVNQVVAKAEEENTKVLIDTGGDEPQYIPKTRLDEEISKKKLIQSQLDNANSTVKDLEKSLKSNEDVQETIKKLEDTNKELSNKYETSVKKSAVKLAAIKANAIDPEDVVEFADLSKITINADGDAVGADDLVEGIKEKKKYFFGEEGPKGGTHDPGNPGGNPGKSPNPDKGLGSQLADYNQQAVKSSHEARNKFFE